jgi:hypothetical protein
VRQVTAAAAAMSLMFEPMWWHTHSCSGCALMLSPLERWPNSLVESAAAVRSGEEARRQAVAQHTVKVRLLLVDRRIEE